MSELLDYSDRRVVVTGAASGMGEATARLLVRHGAEVHALDVKEPSVDVKSYVRTDLLDAASIDAAVEAIGGPVDALFSCAGLGQTFPNEDILTVNFVGPRHLIEAMLPSISPGGAVVTIASVAGMMWQQVLPSYQELLQTSSFAEGRVWCEAHAADIGEGYHVSKMAMTAYTMLQCKRFAERGVRINTLSPGPTDTPMMPYFEKAMGKEFMDSLPVPLGRKSTAEEQAVALLFLNSPAATYLTGANLFNDGGMTAMMTTMALPS